jgi:hypothetical protein
MQEKRKLLLLNWSGGMNGCMGFIKEEDEGSYKTKLGLTKI